LDSLELASFLEKEALFKEVQRGHDSMAFKDLDIKQEYRSPHDNIVSDFYIPILKHATSYKRAVGYFSSTALVEISKGICSLVQNDGVVQIVASPYLSDEDVEAIRKGYNLRNEIIKNAIIKTLTCSDNCFEQERLNLLANLIADSKLDIKIAITEEESNFGMYHEKMGFFCDNDGNKIAFSGSMNESANAFYSNYESIDVFCNWVSQEEKERVEAKEDAFSRIWNNSEKNITIIDFPELRDEIIKRYKKHPPNFNIDTEEEMNLHSSGSTQQAINKFPSIPVSVTLHDYQRSAIDNWVANNYRGIFDMATGTGKTLTGLGAVARLSQDLGHNLAVIIVCPYQHLVEQWVEDIELFNIKPIIGYSSSSQKDWHHRLETAIFNHKLKVKNHTFFCFVCTNATFSTQKVQKLVGKIKGNTLLLVDEAHNFGAERLRKLLLEKYQCRLALSATIDRHNDEEGTAKLYDFFDKKCIEYTLERAIAEKKLTRYKYYPIITTLNDDEISIYSDLSFEISKCIIKNKNGKIKLNEKGKILAMQRARLVAGATDKLTQLAEYIKPYINDKHILVYCGATNILQTDKDESDTDETDLRQIDAVSILLGNTLKMNVSHFTSREDITERERLKQEFAEGINLQALIAIKCLDEGVNIPAIKTAFILASTTNPKEYIQRRGRVLRLSEGKDFAVIYDFLALPRPINKVSSLTDDQVRREITLVKNELTRAEEFARIAMNMAEAENTIESIKRAYSIDNYSINLEEEYGYV
jgi:superfamily II DNA or RNA helicase